MCSLSTQHCFGTHPGPGTAPQSHHLQALLLQTRGEWEGAGGTWAHRDGQGTDCPAAGKGKEGLNGVQKEGEEPDASLATGNHDGLAATGTAVERSSGHPQHSELLSTITVTLG